MSRIRALLGSSLLGAILYLLAGSQAFAACLCPGCTYEQCVEFCSRSGQQASCAYTPPPSDDDPEEEELLPADVAVTVTPSMGEVDWYGGRVFATYDVTVRNEGEKQAEEVELIATLPPFLMVQRISDLRCRYPGGASIPEPTAPLIKGGQIVCPFDTMEAGASIRFNVTARILNATDLHALQEGEELSTYNPPPPRGLLFKVSAAEDAEPDNNEDLAKVEIPFLHGSVEATRVAMTELDRHFDYASAELAQGCNEYKEDILDALEAIRAENPAVFRNLSYGGITSGDYRIVTGTAGHVGVVVYPKGTNYRETGIIIHGTPSPSPLTLQSVKYQTQIADADIGDLFGRAGWTAMNHLYNRTPASLFPGKPQEESRLGFEGRYGDNGPEFTFDGSTAALPEPPPPMGTCPFAPDAVVIATGSPVDLIVTNPRGQRIVTEDGLLVAQELDGGIFSMAFPHEDGTFGWTLVLPRDDYEVQVIGTRVGDYTLTRTTFNAAGEPVDEVTQGFTEPGKVENFALHDAPQKPARSGGGGGGALYPFALLALLSLLGWRRLARRS